MNPFQLTKQLEYELRNLAWPDPPGELVFAKAVQVTAVELKLVLAEARAPSAWIRPTRLEYHREQPSLVEEAAWDVLLLSAASGDRFGRAGVVGGNRASLGKSAGRGVLELEAEVMKRFRAAGLSVQPRGAGAAEVAAVDPAVVTSRLLEVIATRIPSDKTYAAARRFKASVAGGNVTLSWVNPGNRWDLNSMILRRADGATPPASATAGTGVALGSALATSVVDAPGSGQKSYALFASYDETNDPPSQAQLYSTSVTLTATV